MIGVSGFASKWLRACAAAGVVLAVGTARAEPAPQETTGPAYGVEPGEAPNNSVAVPNAPAPAQPANKPATPPAAAPQPASAPPSNASEGPVGAQSQDAAGQPGTTTSTQVSDNDPRALTAFKPQLDPYGTWVEDPKYGVVWVPDRTVVGEGFSPYVTSGHWALDTDNNWVWVSDFPFGDVVFHYGRWVWTSSYGWSWIPGYQYAPAWVVWRVPTATYAYVGWAPMPPAFVWWGGIGMSIWWGPPYYWVFCPSHYVFAHYPGYYVVHDRGFVHTLAGSTRRYSPPPHAITSSPPAQTARVPASSLPSTRVSAPAHVAGAAWGGGRTPTATSTAMSRGSMTASPSGRHDVPFASPRQASRTFYSPARPQSFDSFRASPRTFAPAPRSYPVAPRPMPQSFSSSIPRAAPPPRTYSPSPQFSAPTRVYSPSPRVYSSPHVSAPAYHAPSHSSFGGSHMSAPHFSGGGHHR